MDRKTQKLIQEFYDVRDLQAKDVLNERDVFKQVRALRTPGGINTRKAIDYIERTLAPDTLTPRGVARGFSKDWTAEYDASVRAMAHLPLAKVAETRRLARILESCRDFCDVLAHVSDFREKEHYAPGILYWLRIKCANLKFLYENYPRERHEYFESNDFALVVFGLTNGFYEGYTVDQNGNLISPKGKELPDPEISLKSFPPEIPTMAAKPRE